MMEDKNDFLKQMPFSYKESKDKLFIHYLGKQVKILSGNEAKKFLTKIADFDDFAKQLALAKITGNFKRGNEKTTKKGKNNDF